MIHDFKIKNDYDYVLECIESKATFNYVCEIGKAECEIDFEASTLEPQVTIKEYWILGFQLTDVNITNNPVMLEGSKRLVDQVKQLCENNNWKLWKY